MTSARFDRDEIAGHAQRVVRAVFAEQNETLHVVGDEARTRLCPMCGPRSRDAVVVNLVTGRWIDHAHGCSGDMFDIVASLAGLDARRDFVRVKELAAELAGLDASTPTGDLTQRRADTARRRAEQERVNKELQRERREEAISRATPTWLGLARRSDVGEQYLASRGVLDVLEHVRFTPSGEVALALHGADGRIVNVVRRRRPGSEPKVLGMKGAPTAGTFIDAVSGIVHGRDVVLCEGMFDALTAHIAWPDAVILGAHGAGNLPRIAAAAIPRVKLAGSRLVLVPHADAAGHKAMEIAGRRALAAGLVLDVRLLLVEGHGAKDLNEAWVSGWRPAR